MGARVRHGGFAELPARVPVPPLAQSDSVDRPRHRPSE